MTRATEKAVRRVVQTRFDGELVAELTAAALVLRPIRCRRGGRADVTMPWGLIYQHALIARATEEERAKRRAKKGRRP